MTDDNRQPLDHLEEVLNGMGFPHERTEETITLRVSFDSDGVNWVIAIAFTVAPSGILFRSPLGLTDLASDSLLEVINRWNVEISVPQVSATDQGEAGVVVVGEGQLTGEASADGINFLQQTLIQCINTLKSQVTLRPLPVEKDGTDPELQRLLDLRASATTKSDEFDVLRQFRGYFLQHGQLQNVANCDFNLGTVERFLGEEARSKNEHPKAVEYFEAAQASFLEAKIYYSDPEHLVPLWAANCDLNLGVVQRFLGEEAQSRNEHVEAVEYLEAAQASFLEAKKYYSDPQHLITIDVAGCNHGLGTVERFLGEEARSKNEHPKAVEYFEAAQASFLEAKIYYSDPEHLVPLWAANCDLNLGVVQRFLGEEARSKNEHPKAVEYFEAAQASFLEAKKYYSDPQHLMLHDMAVCNHGLGVVQRLLGQEAQSRNEHPKAVEYFEAAQASFLEAKKYYSDPQHLMLRDMANCDFELGVVEYVLGEEARSKNEHPKAVEYFEAAQASFLEAKIYYSDPEHLVPLWAANCDLNLGVVQRFLGEEAQSRNEHPKAVEYLEAAQASFLEAKKYYSDPQHLMLHDMAVCNHGLGVVQRLLGQEAQSRNEHPKAVEYFEAAQASFLEAKKYYSDPQHLMLRDMANCDFELGVVEYVLGEEARDRNEHVEAVKHFKEARESYLTAKIYYSDPEHLVPLWVANCNYGLGLVERFLGEDARDRNEHVEAVKHFKEAQTDYLAAKDYFSAGDDTMFHKTANCNYGLGLVERFLGEDARDRNEHVEAVKHFKEARESYLTAKKYYSDPQHLMLRDMANCDFELGVVQRFLGEEAQSRNEHVEAVEYFEAAQASFLEAKIYYSDPEHLVPLWVANCNYELGVVEYVLGEEARGRNEHAQAVGYLKEAQTDYLAAKDYFSAGDDTMFHKTANCNYGLGLVERFLGEDARDRNEHVEAVKHFKEAQTDYLAAKDYFSAGDDTMFHKTANCNYGLGLVERFLGEDARDRNEHVEAVKHFKEARESYLTAKMYYSGPQHLVPLWVANCNYGLGMVEQLLGEEAQSRNEHVEAVEYLEAAQASFIEAKMYYSGPQHLVPLWVANCNYGLGMVEQLLGKEARGKNEHEEAVKHFEAARVSLLGAAKYYSDPEHLITIDVAGCNHDLGVVERLLGEEAQSRNDHAGAVVFFEEARDCFLRAREYNLDPQHLMPLDVANCDFNLGVVELLLRNYRSAHDYFKAARLYFEANKLWEKVADCDFSLAVVAQQLRLPADAASLAISAMTIYDHLYYQLRSYSDRLLWANRHAKMLDIALLAALEDRDDKRVVEIIESARIQALPAPETTSTELAGIVTHSAAHAHIASPPYIAPAVGISLATVAAQGSLAGDPLGPPHGVRLGDGDSLAKSVGIDVSELLGTDNIPEVVNIAEIAKLVGGDNAYWFGSWVSGGALYWYLLGPSGVMDIGNVAMEYLDPLIGQLAQGLPDRLSEEEDDEALGRRVFDSLFFDRERELDLAWSLGEALMPEVLRKLLSTLNGSEPISLVIAPAPEIAHIPFPWLSVDEKGTRLIEKAVLRLGASVGLLHEANRLPSNKGAGVLAMLDPTGDLFTSKDLTMQDGTIRTMHLPPDSAASDLADYDALILTNQRHHNDIAASGMYICDKATKQVLESRLASSMPEIFLYLGHIVRGLTPAESGLVFLRNPGNPDASLLARELFSTKAWPMPQRVVFIGCGGARQESREWHGMAPASLCAGARLVLAAQWDLLWMELPGAPGKPWPTYQLALGALEAMKSADPVASWRDRQLKELTQWRSAKHRVPIEHSPIFWSGIMAMGFID